MRTLAAIIALSLASTALLAQDDAKIQAARAEVQAERTKLVAANLPLQDALVLG